MKKILICSIASLMLAPLVASAQSENFAEKPSTETTQSVSLNLQLPFSAGLHYAYELPIARRATIIGRIGADAYASWGYNMWSGNWSYLAITPTIDIEPRFYYGFDRREAHGRSTAGNAGSFLALQVKNMMPFGYVSDNDLYIAGATFITPMWGLRRVWADHWQFEFTAGAHLGLGWNGGLQYGPHVGLRFGFSF